MPTLPANPTLTDVQLYVRELERERGFSQQSGQQKALLLGEEIGELFKAIRKTDAQLRTDPRSTIGTIDEELADILIYLCAIANRYGIDLETAFRTKEEKNKQRTWA
ncbi:MAG: MazG nucleotide pyrophosphohydrolase domain-containing protein [bacterium]|nr:MazG nucleotide pyrophosphohydrolase domain-containing protein [bacterium]